MLYLPKHTAIRLTPLLIVITVLARAGYALDRELDEEKLPVNQESIAEWNPTLHLPRSCGTRAIVLLCDAYGRSYDLAHLQEILKTGEGDVETSLGLLKAAADYVGLYSAPLDLSGRNVDRWIRLKCPAIIHLPGPGNGHFVVAFPESSERIWLFDPVLLRNGAQMMDAENLQQLWNGGLLIISDRPIPIIHNHLLQILLCVTTSLMALIVWSLMAKRVRSRIKPEPIEPEFRELPEGVELIALEHTKTTIIGSSQGQGRRPAAVAAYASLNEEIWEIQWSATLRPKSIDRVREGLEIDAKAALRSGDHIEIETMAGTTSELVRVPLVEF